MKRYLIFISILIAILVICIGFIFFNKPVSNHKVFSAKDAFVVHDKDLLSPEQQRILVREGRVILPDGTELLNNQENRVYLNEGGLEHGIK